MQGFFERVIGFLYPRILPPRHTYPSHSRTKIFWLHTSPTIAILALTVNTPTSAQPNFPKVFSRVALAGDEGSYNVSNPDLSNVPAPAHRPQDEVICPAPEQNRRFRCCTQHVSAAYEAAESASLDFRFMGFDAIVRNRVQDGCTWISHLRWSSRRQWEGSVRLCGAAGYVSAGFVGDALEWLEMRCGIVWRSNNTEIWRATGGTAWVPRSRGDRELYVLLGTGGDPEVNGSSRSYKREIGS